MTDARWVRLAEIVPEALALPADARGAYLDRACVDGDGAPDPDLRADAAALVAASDAADASGALVSPLTATTAGTDALPERIGPWRVTALLGEGGMGVVYRAHRDDGLFEREVALKRIRPGLGHALAHRLDAERHVLARLEHDGIARLYDGGLSDDGTPYVVMEFVDGLPITGHAATASLDTEARLALFVRVCEAVAYAHQRLVVHRDLKPSNVFVTADGSVKLLDFGIAKILAPDGGGAPADSLAETLTRTQTSMTPSYAAPEQLRGGEITTASDVYALGVMLYELLAGQRPYSLVGLSPAEVERVVCESEPPPPSTVAPADRARELRGDLDVICLKALAKEPERRYASVEALASDLQRHLDGLPVQARPSTAGYRARRFVGRHRVGVAATALVAVALVAGATVALWQARVARAEAAKAEAVNGFLVGLLGAAEPDRDGRDVRVADLLDRAAAAVDSTLAGQPDVAAKMHHTLGMTYRDLGLYDEAERELRRALALWERLHGPRHPDVSETQYSLGRTRREQGDLAEADSLLRRALATDRALFGPRDSRVSFILNDLGLLSSSLGDLDGAAAYLREAHAIDVATLPPDDINLLIGMGTLARALADLGRLDEAAQILERRLAILRRAHPDDDVNLAFATGQLGSVRSRQDRHREAALFQTEALQRFLRAFGDGHPNVALARSRLGGTLNALGRPDEAERLLRPSIAGYRAALGPRAPDLAVPLANLGQTLQAQGRPDEAERVFAEAETIGRDGLGAETPDLARVLAARGTFLVARGRPAEAVPLLREARAIRRASLPDGHPDRAVTASLLGDALRRAGRTAEAERLLVASHAALTRAAAADSSVAARLGDAASRLADLRDAQGQAADARRPGSAPP